MNFCYPDLRPSLRGQKPTASSFLATEVEFDGRVLPEATASTPVFLMIAIRCSCSRSKNRCAQEAQQWQLMLEDLFLQYLPLAFQVLMPLRIGMPRLPDEPPAGTHMELMECTRTTINLAGVSQTLLEALPKVVLEELDCNGCIPLCRFACILDAAGASALNLYSHFLHGIAVVLEAQLLSDQSDSLVVTLPIVAGAPSKIDLGKTAKAMKASRDANIAQMLCKYFYAGRKHFSAEVSYLSLACDATRMGKRSCMIGCVASPGNLFMWSPPQAIRQIMALNPTTIRTAKLRFGGLILDWHCLSCNNSKCMVEVVIRFPFSQVLKDMRSAIQAALEERDQAKVEAEKEEWRRRASQAWTDIAKDSATGPDVELSKKKSYRGKALEWCVAVDHMLWSASGQRLSFFCQKGALAERPPPQAWPVLTLAIDQGSDGWCAAYYLMMAKQCGLLLCKDTSHRIWNDTWLAIEHSELKPIFLLLIVVLNSDHGPWKDA
eukprot:16452358-Heterocapsa_arctica.AAC.1